MDNLHVSSIVNDFLFNIVMLEEFGAILDENMIKASLVEGMSVMHMYFSVMILSLELESSLKHLSLFIVFFLFMLMLFYRAIEIAAFVVFLLAWMSSVETF